MRFRDYIKEKMVLIIGTILALVSVEILLLAYNISILIRVYCAFIIIFILVLAILIEYKKKKDYYNELIKNMEDLKEKYLISEIIKTPNFIEGKILKDILQDTGKSMLENVNYYKNIQEDYKEYIELWIHEVKIPIATSKMIIENNKNEVTKIIQNAIKYSKKENKKIEISSQEKNDKVILYIKDNGIGIKKGEITRVFERGFTGENGRIIGQKSTGIGLYLCKKLCDRLGLGIELNSEKDKGTEVRIIFPKNSYTNF